MGKNNPWSEDNMTDEEYADHKQRQREDGPMPWDYDDAEEFDNEYTKWEQDTGF